MLKFLKTIFTNIYRNILLEERVIDTHRVFVKEADGDTRVIFIIETNKGCKIRLGCIIPTKECLPIQTK